MKQHSGKVVCESCAATGPPTGTRLLATKAAKQPSSDHGANDFVHDRKPIQFAVSGPLTQNK